MPNDSRSLNITLFPRIRGLFPRLLNGQPFPRLGVEVEQQQVRRAMMQAGFDDDEIQSVMTEFQRLVSAQGDPDRYRYATEAEAQAVAQQLGLDGIHFHDTEEGRIYMPGETHQQLNQALRKQGREEVSIPGEGGSDTYSGGSAYGDSFG